MSAKGEGGGREIGGRMGESGRKWEKMGEMVGKGGGGERRSNKLDEKEKMEKRN